MVGNIMVIPSTLHSNIQQVSFMSQSGMWMFSQWRIFNRMHKGKKTAFPEINCLGRVVSRWNERALDQKRLS
jgi:hypothetical protein